MTLLISLNESSDFINVGDSVTLSLVITNPQSVAGGPIGLVPGGVVAEGTTFFFSGDGQQTVQFFGIPPNGPSEADFTFTYQTPGVFIPSAAGGLFFEAVVCDVFPPSCEPVGNSSHSGADFVVTGAPIAVGVAEPATWLLLLLGFAAVAFAKKVAAKTSRFVDNSHRV